MIVWITLLSVVFQITAAILALRLIRPSRGRMAWVLIATAFFLRSIRLIYQLYLYFNTNVEYNLLGFDEILGLGVSVLFALGVYKIRPLFESFQKAEETREIYSHTILTT